MVRQEELRSMTDAWRAYLDLALGFTETSRKRAIKVAKKLVGKGGATAGQLQAMAEDLISTGLTNREALSRLVRFELDRALGRVGLATAEEVGELTARVRELEQQLRAAQAVAVPRPAQDVVAEAAPVTVPVTVPPAAAAKKAVKKVAAKKVAAQKVAAAKVPAKQAAGQQAEGAPGTAPARTSARARAAQ